MVENQNPKSVNLIREEVRTHLVEKIKEGLDLTKSLAITEVWKILQLVIAGVIQIIENIGTDLSSPEKKTLAMDIIGKFYDTTFTIIDIPLVPKILQPIIQRYIRTILMLLVSASIDSMVTIFKNTGVFLKTKYV